MVVSMNAIALTMILFHVLWSFKMVPFLNNQGFVTSIEYKELTTTIQDLRRKNLVRTILESRKNQCRSTGKAKDLYTHEIAELLEEYQRLFGQAFQLPDCEDFAQG